MTERIICNKNLRIYLIDIFIVLYSSVAFNW